MIGFVQLQVVEEVLAIHLDHSCIPNQITLNHRRGRKSLEEVRPHRAQEIIAITKSLHEVAFLRRSEWRRAADRIHLGDVFPYDLSSRQPARILSRESLTEYHLALGVRRVVVHGKPVRAGAVVLRRRSLWQGPG